MVRDRPIFIEFLTKLGIGDLEFAESFSFLKPTFLSIHQHQC